MPTATGEEKRMWRTHGLKPKGGFLSGCLSIHSVGVVAVEHNELNARVKVGCMYSENSYGGGGRIFETCGFLRERPTPAPEGTPPPGIRGRAQERFLPPFRDAGAGKAMPPTRRVSGMTAEEDSPWQYGLRGFFQIFY